MTAPPAGALEACPFCGGGAEVMIGYHARTDAKVGCTDCGAEGPLFGSNDFSGGDHAAEAIAAWNRRAHGPALLAALRLREGCAELVARIEREADAHTYFVDNAFLRMTTSDHAKRAAQLTTIRDDLARVLEETK